MSAKRAAFGRAISRVRIDARIGDDNRPPYAADIPLSVFVARMSSPSFRRSESQVPSPPPIFPSASSGPRLAPPASDTTETATAPGTVEGSTRWSVSSLTVPGSLAGTRKSRRSTPTITPAPAVTATHQRLPSSHPGSSGSVNQSLVPPFTNPRNASAAKASTTPNKMARRMIGQNPGDCVRATLSASGLASSRVARVLIGPLDPEQTPRGPHGSYPWASRAQRKPTFPAEVSGDLPCRAATR